MTMSTRCQSLSEWEKMYDVKLNPCTVKGGLFWDVDYMLESHFFDLLLEHGYTGKPEFKTVLDKYVVDEEKRISDLATRFKAIMDEDGIKYTEAGEGKGKLTITDDDGDVVAVVGGEDGMSGDEFASFMWNLPYTSSLK